MLPDHLVRVFQKSAITGVPKTSEAYFSPSFLERFILTKKAAHEILEKF